MLVSLLFLNALVNRRQVLSRHYHSAMHMMIILLTVENPRDGEPGGLPSMGSHRVGHDWSDLAAAAGHCVDNFLTEVHRILIEMMTDI